MKKFQSPAYKLSKSMKNMMLAQAYVAAKTAGVKLNVCRIDNDIMRQANDERDDLRINVDVHKGIVRKAWVG